MPGKVTRALYQALVSGDRSSPVPIIVRFREGVVTALSLAGGTPPRYHFAHFRGAAYTVRPEEVAELVQAPDVDRIWLDLPVHAFLDASVPHIGTPALWHSGLTGRGVKVCIIDSGIDPNHPDFAGRIADGVGLVASKYVDDNGHGTHVAGIAAGSGAASKGKYRGVAPEASLYIAKALDSEGNGMMSDVMAGIEWAVEQRVQVVGMSLGTDGPADGSDALSQACDLAVQAGIVVCCAAGNSGPTRSSVGVPGAARRVITVGASSDADAVTGFSGRGPTSDGRDKPDIVFPGLNITSCRAAGTTLGESVDEHYTEASGTSMATPHAVGAVALLLQGHPGAQPEDVKRWLFQTAVSLGADANTQGSGRADLAAAERASTEPTSPQPSPTPPGTVQPTVPPSGQNTGGGCLRIAALWRTSLAANLRKHK